ncbi:hypothetical protein MATL_G00106450 [Megalops atlanticus]|uniref:TNFR-Cys domain-containing protein n=1 Tax=Megalops atlanticus TaxID=7932 RepID=A0A9D3Q296_MEGAT|nr:hypothetical protein MATL_G00106450 [Megalops atlanticus]
MRTALRPVMETTSWALLTTLLLMGCADASHEVARGCARWTPSGLSEICCERCKPGNRVYKRCGLDPRELCVPCEEGTYTLDPTQEFCQTCTQCIGVHFEKQACTSSSDTVCGCRTGYRCGDSRCSYCVEECGMGQEPTERRTCRDCPSGTFNDQIHQKCKPWRTSCPDPQQRIVDVGTAVRDSICGNFSAVNPEVITFPTKKDSRGWKVAAIAFICLCLSVTLVVAFAYIISGKIMKKKPSTKPSVVEKAAEGPQRVAQQEDCSFCHPQQEQGGSTDSVCTEDSDFKLLPV